jgi:hypothetical protein
MTADREPQGSPVTAVRRTSRGPSAGLALIVVGAAVTAGIAVALLSGPTPKPAPAPVALVSAAPSGAPTGLPSASPTASPAGHAASTILVLRGEADPAGALLALTGCPTGMRSIGYPLTPGIKGADVDAVAAAAGRTTGWLFVPPGIQASSRVWLGQDLVELARAVGQPVVAASPKGEVWLGGRSGATRWVPVPTPLGRTAWVMATEEFAATGSCGPWPVPTLIDGQRSVTCADLGAPACFKALAGARSDIPGLEYAGGDVAVTVARCAQRALGCADPPVVAIATPDGWPSSTAELRAATRASATRAFALTDQNLLPDSPLDVLARPGLPLPAANAPPSTNACLETIDGMLLGSPWDPRVAWVQAHEVVWPKGTSVWFVPDIVVEVIGKTDGTTAYEFDHVKLTGRLGADGRFDACTMTLGSASAPASSGVGEVPAGTPGPPGGRGTGG